MTKSEINIDKLNRLVVLLSTYKGSIQELSIVRKLVYDLKEALKELDSITQTLSPTSDQVSEVTESPTEEPTPPVSKQSKKGKKTDVEPV